MSKIKAKNQKKYCGNCGCHYTGGVKDGKYDNWCCKFSMSAAKAISHCVNVGGIVVKNI